MSEMKKMSQDEREKNSQTQKKTLKKEKICQKQKKMLKIKKKMSIIVMRSMKRDHKSGKNAHFCT